MSKQQEYPYIGKHVYTGTVIFLHTQKEGIILEGKGQYPTGEYRTDWITGNWIDVTEQYLQNKDVPIESPEHSEYIQRMAFRYGYRWRYSKDKISNTDKNCLNFWVDKNISYDEGILSADFTQLHLPLPPDHRTVKNLITKGTTVLVGGAIGIVALPKDNNDNYVVLLDGDVYTLAHKDSVKELAQEDIKQHKIKSRLEEILLPYVDDISVCDDIMNEFTLEER